MQYKANGAICHKRKFHLRQRDRYVTNERATVLCKIQHSCLPRRQIADVDKESE